MDNTALEVEVRLRAVEQQLRRARRFVALTTTGLLVMAVASWISAPAAPDEIVTRRLVVVGEDGQPRVVIGSEGEDSERVAGYAGITIHDSEGSERGGLGVLDDGTAVMALDAPPGVGASMRDRIGLTVARDGSAVLRLIDNRTMVPVRLVTEADGQGGLELLDYDLEAREVHVKRITYGGESERTESLGG